ncbi:hypothetical protein NC652_036336 [Populus alba x Populus x berolinensis]|nr:hypothetical protein NC652_036336 [Populus alba x Populus x berolinensis]
MEGHALLFPVHNPPSDGIEIDSGNIASKRSGLGTVGLIDGVMLGDAQNCMLLG